jgi:hypothetical protein
MVKVIDRFHVEMTLNWTVQDLLHKSVRCILDTDTKAKYRNWWTDFKNQFLNGSDIMNNLGQKRKYVLHQSTLKFLEVGDLSMYQWLVDEWNVDLTLKLTTKEITDIIINGPSKQYFTEEELTSKYCVDVILKNLFNVFFMEWDGRSDISIFIKSLKYKKDMEYAKKCPMLGDDWIYEYRTKLGFQCSGYRDHLHKFANNFLLKSAGQEVKERITTLKWMIDKRTISLPDLHCFVLKGQHHLLQWYCNAKYIDIYAPLRSIPSFSEYISTNTSWFINISGSTINTEVSVVEALCVLAAGLGEFPTLYWLMREKVKSKGFLVNGTNMLHIAAARGYLHIVKWLVKMEWLSLKKLTALGLSACHLALDNGFFTVGLYLLDLPEFKTLNDSKGKPNLVHAIITDCNHFEREYKNRLMCRYLSTYLVQKVTFSTFELVLDSSGLTEYFISSDQNLFDISLNPRQLCDNNKDFSDHFSMLFTEIVKLAMAFYGLDFVNWLRSIYERSKVF